MAKIQTGVDCEGYSLHFFDAGLGNSGRGSDKFYRALYHANQDGSYTVVLAWGRDGTTGQAQAHHIADLYDAKKLIEKKRVEKMRHGYEQLGQGEARINFGRYAQLTSACEEFAVAIDERPPDKSRMSGGFIIQEEPDISSLFG